MKLNCWEMKKCGREPGGLHEKEFGSCPAATYTALDGLHGGKNAGRACWVVSGSLCGGRIQGHEEQKRAACWECDFLKLVKKDEGPERFGFSHTRLCMDRVKQKAGTL